MKNYYFYQPWLNQTAKMQFFREQLEKKIFSSLFRIEFLRHIRDFFQVMFKIEVQTPLEDERKGGDKVLMTCVGVGYSNISKTVK